MAEKEIPTASKRKSIGSKLRFEVFKRDSFTCQYCGRSAPDVILEVDHICPASAGGSSDITNLITSCRDCNRGKGKRKLSENDEVKKSQKQLEELNERRKQIEMMMEWKKSLSRVNEDAAKSIEDMFLEKTGWSFTDSFRKKLSGLVKKYGFEEVYDSTEISISQYFEEGNFSSASKCADYISRICYNRKMQKDHPEIKDINVILKIASMDKSYFNRKKAFYVLERMYSGDDFESLVSIAKRARNWCDFKEKISLFYGREMQELWQ